MFNLFKVSDITEIINNYNDISHSKVLNDFFIYLRRSKEINYIKIFEFIQNNNKNFSEVEINKIIKYLINKFNDASENDKYYIISSIFELNLNFITKNKVKNLIFDIKYVDILEKIYIKYIEEIIKCNELIKEFWNIFLLNNNNDFILKYLTKDIIEKNPLLLLDYFSNLEFKKKAEDVFIIEFYIKKLKDTSLKEKTIKYLKAKFEKLSLKCFKSKFDIKEEGVVDNLFNTINIVNYIYEHDKSLKFLVEFTLIEKIDNNLYIILNPEGESKGGFWENIKENLILFDTHTQEFIELFENYFINVKNQIPHYYIVYLVKHEYLLNNYNSEELYPIKYEYLLRDAKERIRLHLREYINNNNINQLPGLINKLFYRYLFGEFVDTLDIVLLNDFFLLLLKDTSLYEILFILESSGYFNKLFYILSNIGNNFYIELLKKESGINNKNIYQILFLYLFSKIYNYLDNSGNLIIYGNTLEQVGIYFNEKRSKKFISFINKLIKEKNYNLALFSILNNSNRIFRSKKSLPIIIQKMLEIIKEIDFDLNEFYIDLKKYFHLMDLITLETLGELFLYNQKINEAKNVLSIIENVDRINPYIKKANNLIQKYENISKLANQEIDFNEINSLSGVEFEELVAKKFSDLGFQTYITPKSRDYGADVIVECKDKKVAIQCKRFKNKVNLKAVQEIVSALSYYNADFGIVITNNEFLDSAINLAESNNIELWDNLKLLKFLNNDLSFSNIF